MPQYNAYTLVTALLPDDIIAFWKDAANAMRTIAFSDLVESVAGLISHVDSVDIVTGNTTLNGDYQFVVGNSAGALNITLPLAVSFPGQRYTIGNKGAGTISVLASGSDGILAGSLAVSTTIAQYKTYDFVSDGVDSWYAVAK